MEHVRKYSYQEIQYPLKVCGWCVVSATIAKQRKARQLPQSSEVNQAIYTAVDKPKKKENHNVYVGLVGHFDLALPVGQKFEDLTS